MCLLLTHKDSRVKISACGALAAVKNVAKKEVESVARRLVDDDALVRSAAIKALGVIGEQSDANQVASALQDKDERCRGAACEALVAMCDISGHTHAAHIAEKLKDQHWSVRVSACVALGGMKEAGSEYAAIVSSRLVCCLKFKPAKSEGNFLCFVG